MRKRTGTISRLREQLQDRAAYGTYEEVDKFIVGGQAEGGGDGGGPGGGEFGRGAVSRCQRMRKGRGYGRSFTALRRRR